MLKALMEHGTVVKAAQSLYLSPNTVEWHLARLRRKSGVHHLHQLTAIALLYGWLEEGEVQLPVPYSERAIRGDDEQPVFAVVGRAEPSSPASSSPAHANSNKNP